MAEQGQQGAHRIPENVDLSSLVEDAKKVFYQDPNVIGVGVGHRRRGAATLHNEVVLIVYGAHRPRATTIAGDQQSNFPTLRGPR